MILKVILALFLSQIPRLEWRKHAWGQVNFMHWWHFMLIRPSPQKASLILNVSSSDSCVIQWSTSWVWRAMHQCCEPAPCSFYLLSGNIVPSLPFSGMKVNTPSQRQALPGLPRVDTRKVRVAATRPHPACISQRVDGRSTVDHGHHKVPNTHEGKLRCQN